LLCTFSDARAAFYPFLRADGPIRSAPTKKEAILMDLKLAATAQLMSLMKFSVTHHDDGWLNLPMFKKMKVSLMRFSVTRCDDGWLNLSMFQPKPHAAVILAEVTARYHTRYRVFCRELEDADIIRKDELQAQVGYTRSVGGSIDG
jgi:hypothetical protein